MGRLRELRPRLRTLETRRVLPPTKKIADSFYSSPEWRSLLAHIFTERGRRCQDPDCRTPHGPWNRIVGDHIVEIKDGGERLDPNNVLLRCDPCHGRKTEAERVKRMSAVYE